MWYIYRRGSGIFYRMGRTKTAPGKNLMLASLLHEAAKTSQGPDIDQAWRSMVTFSGLCDPARPTEGLLGDADRILSAANGTSTCAELGLRACRCKIVRARDGKLPCICKYMTA